MNIKTLRKSFESPSREFGPAPFWALNDDLDPDRLRAALRDFADKGMSGVFMHPRTGLEVDYLSEEFWERIGVIIDECEKLGLKAWIYDEYNWPSGPAGGRVLEANPEYIMPYLEYVCPKLDGEQELDHPGKAIAAFLVGNMIDDLSENIRDGRFHPPSGTRGDLLLFYEDRVVDAMFVTNNAPWCAEGNGYLDLMNPDAVDAFMEVTHHQYAKRFRGHFGKTIPGLFTDEPQFYRGFPWTGAFAGAFKEIKGYDLVEKLFMLVLDRKGYSKLRTDYYEVVEELYAKSFYCRVREWCDKEGLIFTGHLGMEERLSQMPINHGGIYGPLKHMSMPGIDALGHGNPVVGGLVNMEVPNFAPRAAAAISRLHGNGRVLCEAGGGCGWRGTPLDLKLQLDWLFASGVNFINPHHCLLSIKGLRKRDFPPTHTKVEPWFEYYRIHSEYISRLSMLMSIGEPSADLALLVPMAAIRSALRGRGVMNSDDANNVLIPFTSIMDFLVWNQRDFELVFEGAVGDGLATIKDDRLCLGEREFKVLVIPPCKVMDSDVADLVIKYLGVGGRVALFDEIPRYDTSGADIIEKMLPVFRRATEAGTAIQLSSRDGFSREGVLGRFDRLCPPRIRVEGDIAREVICHQRVIGETDVCFLANQGHGQGQVTIFFKSSRAVLEQWDPASGSGVRLPWKAEEDGGASVRVYFHPGQSIVLVGHGKEDDVKLEHTNLEVLSWTGNKLKGITTEPCAELNLSSGKRTVEGTSPPLPIVLMPDWRISPENDNALLLEPWNVRTGKAASLPIKDLDSERYFTARTRKLIKAGRPLVKLAEAIRPPGKKFRTERYFKFGETERMTGPASRITGIDIERWGLYEGMGALSRLGDYLGSSTVMRSFPPPGADYEAGTTFMVDHVPDTLLLVYEDLGVPVSFKINGKAITSEPGEVSAWDPSCRAHEISGLIRKGKNKLVMKSTQLDWHAMPPNTHSIEPVALLGFFNVRDNKLVEPESGAISEGDWQKRGYPYYSGPMLYKRKFDLPEEYMSFHLVLELNEVHECVEVKVNGKAAGTRIYPPFTFPISDVARAGENELEVRVVNTAANFFARPRVSGIIGMTRIVPYSLYEIDLDEDKG